MGKYRKYLEFGALVFLAVAIIWWFGRRLDWVQVKVAVQRSDWRLILAGAGVVLLGYLWRAIRWQALLAPLAKASLREVWIATTVGFGAVLLIGRAGEVVRPVVLPMRDKRVRPAAAFVTIMVERLYDTIAVVSIFAVNLLWLAPSAGRTEEFSRARIVGWGLVALLAIIVALLIWFKRRSTNVIGWLDQKIRGKSHLGARLKRAVLSTLEQLATALSVLSDRRQLAISAGLSVLLWASVALGNLLVCRAFGLSFGVSQILFVMGWSMVGSAVPTPGGAAGAFHAATGAALVLLGVPQAQAAAVAIILHLVDFAPAALFGLFYFLRGDINVSRLRALISVRAVEHAVEDEKVALAEGA
ncbi:MAG: lysylphosphatidylglycerol synthase transmembrane domain-containing protein [Acidobacteriota bacterium]